MVISKELPKCIHMEHVIMTWEKRFFFLSCRKAFGDWNGQEQNFILKVMLLCSSVLLLLLFELHRVENNYMLIK